MKTILMYLGGGYPVLKQTEDNEKPLAALSLAGEIEKKNIYLINTKDWVRVLKKDTKKFKTS